VGSRLHLRPMAQLINKFKADLREIRFLLFQQLKLQDVLADARYEAWGEDEVNMVLDEVYKYACNVSGPLNQHGDHEACRLQDGRVITPSGYKAAYDAIREQGWKTLAVSPEFGGQGAPFTLQLAADEIITGSNLSFAMYLSLTYGAAELIEAFGTHAQQALYCERMFNGTWGGTMCLTEPHAGTDVGDCKTTAAKQADGSYRIRGTKIFISGGDQDLSENIVHMVLARAEGGAPGSKGLSLFIVPAVHAKADGTLGARNDVQVASIEHKMGIRGSSTCVLNFGDEGECVGYLCGTEEQRGIMQMFQMMNGARITVGMSGYAVASAAYLAALDYAKERKQGGATKDPSSPRIPIIQHADVRRMLLDMKARVEGCRALGLTLSMHRDQAQLFAGKDDQKAAFHQQQVEVLTPLLKSYATDQAFQVCQTAIQSYGGAGFLQDHPAEQHCRDSKILAIYEGTNHIQALDLVGRKLRMEGGKGVRDLLGGLLSFTSKHAQHARLAGSIAQLKQGADLVGGLLMALGTKVEAERVPLHANMVLECLSELVVGKLLLEGAVIAHDAQASLKASEPDHAFYEGKQCAAEYFAYYVLPGIQSKVATIMAGNRSPLSIPDAAFATV
jgi:alkylation response protein AidB-like acyl-CoA dehydrogenase